MSFDHESVNPKSDSLILDETELEKFCEKNGLTYNLVDLSELDSAKAPYTFIHTGETKNQFNNGNINHWMFLYGSNVFDSYGDAGDFLYPQWVKPVITRPKRLQEYGANVCGEYCCSFYKFVKGGIDQNDENMGLEFSDTFNFSEDRNKNDRIIQQIFKEDGGVFTSSDEDEEEGGAKSKKKIVDPSTTASPAANIKESYETPVKPVRKVVSSGNPLLEKKKREAILDADPSKKIDEDNDGVEIADVDEPTTIPPVTAEVPIEEVKSKEEENTKFDKDYERYEDKKDALEAELKLKELEILSKTSKAADPEFEKLYKKAMEKVEKIRKEEGEVVAPTKKGLFIDKSNLPDTYDEVVKRNEENRARIREENLAKQKEKEYLDRQEKAFPGFKEVYQRNIDNEKKKKLENATKLQNQIKGFQEEANLAQQVGDVGEVKIGTEAPVQRIPLGPQPNIETDPKVEEIRNNYATAQAKYEKEQQANNVLQVVNPNYDNSAINIGNVPGDPEQPIKSNEMLGYDTPMPPNLQELYPTIPREALEPIMPHPVKKLKAQSYLPKGGSTAAKRLSLEGQVTPNSKKIKAVTQVQNTIQSFVPLQRGGIEPAGDQPFQHPPLAILTAVPQLLTTDPGLLKLTKNKL
jgi:hypothetical protein